MNSFLTDNKKKVNRTRETCVENSKNNKNQSMATWDAFSLIWIDANVDEIQLIDDKFRSIAKDIKKLNTIQQCHEYISQISINDRIIFIVSGQSTQSTPSTPSPSTMDFTISKGKFYNIHKYKIGFHSFYFFIKIKAVVVTIDELIHRLIIERRMHRKMDESLPIDIYNSDGQSTTGLNGRFVYSQILIDCLLRLQSNDYDRYELIQFCRHRYQTNSIELQHLYDFEHEYTPNKVLW